jgi:hypothetical protein
MKNLFVKAFKDLYMLQVPKNPIHSVTTLVALQCGIQSFLLTLSWERQQGNGILGLGLER